jgi:hypothetical protein
MSLRSVTDEQQSLRRKGPPGTSLYLRLAALRFSRQQALAARPISSFTHFALNSHPSTINAAKFPSGGGRIDFISTAQALFARRSLSRTLRCQVELPPEDCVRSSLPISEFTLNELMD